MDVTQYFEEGLSRAVLSKPRKESPYTRVTVKPVLIDDERRYQFEYVLGAQATHANLLPDEAAERRGCLVHEEIRVRGLRALDVLELVAALVVDQHGLDGDPRVGALLARLRQDRPREAFLEVLRDIHN